MNPSTIGAVELELPAQRFIGLAAEREPLDVHGVGNDRYLLRIDAARDDIRAQAFADRRHGIGTLQCVGFERARQSIARRPLARAAVIDRGVFPECANFVEDRHAEPASHPQRGNRVQRRRVRVQQVRSDLLRRPLADGA